MNLTPVNKILRDAIVSRSLLLVHHALANGADPNCATEDGVSMVGHAIEPAMKFSLGLDVLEVLLKAGGSPDKHPDTICRSYESMQEWDVHPVAIATHLRGDNYERVMHLLLDHGADMHEPMARDGGILARAMYDKTENGRDSVVDLISAVMPYPKAMMDMMSGINQEGKSVFYLLVEYAASPRIAIEPVFKAYIGEALADILSSGLPVSDDSNQKFPVLPLLESHFPNVARMVIAERAAKNSAAMHDNLTRQKKGLKI